MKKLTIMLLICALSLSLFCFIPGVAAEGESYYYIKADTTMILEGNSISGTINLPASWYVKVSSNANTPTDVGITYRYVEYNGLLGKVDASKLSQKTTTLSTAPYFNSKIESITKKLPLCSDSNCEVFIGGSGLPVGSSVNILAITTNDNYVISYLQDNQTKFACIIKEISGINVTPTENVNKKDPDQIGGGDSLTPPTNNNDKTTPTNNILRILLIVGICILAVLLVFLIFKPTRKSDKDSDFYHDFPE